MKKYLECVQARWAPAEGTSGLGREHNLVDSPLDGCSSLGVPSSQARTSGISSGCGVAKDLASFPRSNPGADVCPWS